MIPFFQEQIEFLLLIASWRTPWLDQIFLFLGYLDSPYFLMVLIPFVWVGVSYRWGIRIAFLLIINALLNFHLKYLFLAPRPDVACQGIALQSLHSPGLPSGGAQMAMLLGALLFFLHKNSWVRFAAVFYVLLASFARLYLGVHYLSDVIGGWIVGFLIAFIYLAFSISIERFLIRTGLTFCSLAVLLFSATSMLLFPNAPTYSLMGALAGFTLGIYISLKNHLYAPPPKSLWHRTAAGLLAILSTYAIRGLCPASTPPFLSAFVTALWISAAATPFCRFFHHK
ncbi:MAG: phosphatase PAP2 family protein [Chlamydiia bacterium]|nr:phosphatase PAP2 family protein [Chlamydiia bacterium]